MTAVKPAALNRSLETYAACRPDIVMGGSFGQAVAFVADAKRDIAALAEEIRELRDIALPMPETHSTNTADLVTVPREPTPEMLKAGAIGSGEDSETVARGAWDAMVSASPAPALSPQHPAGVREALDVDTIAKAISSVGYPEEVPGDGFAWWWHEHNDRNSFAEEGRDEDRRKAKAVIAALDPSPPLPEADGEVVAQLRRASETNKSFASDLMRQLMEDQAAREKAEQVAAGLREEAAEDALDRLYEAAHDCLEIGVSGMSWLHSQGCRTQAERAALRASTEEGKTAKPQRDNLPTRHYVLEQADMMDGTGRVAQTVSIGREGSPGATEYQRIVHADEAYGAAE